MKLFLLPGIRQWVAFCGCWVLLWTATKASPDPGLNQILDRHAAAMGGKTAWAALLSWKIAQETENGRRSTAIAQKPDRFKLIFESGEDVLIKGYDGQNGWLLRNGVPEAMRPGEAIEMAEEPEFYEELMFCRENGHRVRLVGRDTLAGRQVFRIELEKKKEDVQTYFVNAETYLIDAVGEYSEDTAWAGVFFLTRFENYRSVEGLMFPFRWSLESEDRPAVWRRVTAVELNPILLDEVFVRPDPARIADATGLVRAMHAEASGAAFDQYTFVQTTIRYQPDGTVRDTMTWYEAVSYPDRFRIDFGEPEKGSAIIYRNDSSYLFKDHGLLRAQQEFMPFLMLEGGLRCMTMKEVLVRMGKFGYDMTRFRRDRWAGREVYVIGGSSPEDLRSKQIWVDVERLIPVRRIDPQPDGKVMEVVYGNFERHDGGWIETRVDFFISDDKVKRRLMQVEFYQEIDTRVELQPSLFEPGRFGEWHWRAKK